jgi:hypothetical protein
MSTGLSKSRLMSFLQCPKRLWLEKHRPDLVTPDPQQEAVFAMGHEIGDVARRLYDSGGGLMIEYDAGLTVALQRTGEVLAQRSTAPVFEATFERDGLLVRADVLERGRKGPRLVEVKASTRVKDEHVTDCAIQSWVLEASVARPRSVSLAHVDNAFVYPGDGRYAGLLKEQDLSADLAPQREEVPAWLRDAKQVLRGPEPQAQVGTRCFSPYACPFQGYCWKSTDHPLTDLPGIGRRLDALLARDYHDVRDLPEDELRTDDQRRVWRAARRGRPEVSRGARDALAELGWPRYYLDFETIAFAVPRWAGTRPYQPLPFQWSLHVETAPGAVEYAEFLDLTGELPVRALAKALIDATRHPGPVLTYTGYEQRCLRILAEFCPDLRGQLDALGTRLVDLHPIAKRHYYHPAMHGSWSIKALLPTIAPELDYARLEEIQDGNAAQQAYLEAIAPGVSPGRKAQLRQRLLDYCGQDTLAMVAVARYLEGRSGVARSPARRPAG